MFLLIITNYYQSLTLHHSICYLFLINKFALRYKLVYKTLFNKSLIKIVINSRMGLFYDQDSCEVGSILNPINVLTV